MAYADLEAIAIAWLTANIFTETGASRVLVVDKQPGNVPHTARYCWVRKSPSSPGDDQPTMDVTDLDVDAFARNRARAKEIAEQVRTAIRYQFGGYTDPSTRAVIKRRATLTPPVEAPWEQADVVRYTSSYRIWVHHNPLA